jgi:Zn-dependent M28 family amino/carboxypeptidase
MKRFRSFALLAVLAPALLSAQKAQPCTCAAKITATAFDADLKFLSSDLLEGRAPATRGGQLAAAYIAAQLQIAGVLPGANGSYFQKVPIDVVGAIPSTIHVAASGKAKATLNYPNDVVVGPGSATDSSVARGELVFVGYGAQAPEYKWDDYKGESMKGKVLLVLVNDPPASASEPGLFGGKAMTYYGRWTYKYEQGERLGAAGVLIVHTTEAASYPWHTVVGSWAKEIRMLPRDPNGPAPNGVNGWITDSAASALLAQAGFSMGDLRAQAATRAFKPVHTGIMMDMSMKNHVAHMQSENVVGVVNGNGSGYKDQYVVYSAHWDHLGIGPPVNGDSIYNGAADNASGTAAVIAIARAAAKLAPTRRTQLFVFVTAEESGLLGSAWFATHPTVPVKQIIADLNLDVVPLEGRMKDYVVLGSNKSTLGAEFSHLLQVKGMSLTADPHPEAGHFYRSDHFSFAKAGVPAISIGAGTDYVGRPKGWGEAQQADYTAHRYHQPSDEYKPDFDLSGATQLADIVLSFGRALANSPLVPEWNAGAEFKAMRDSTGGPAK